MQNWNFKLVYSLHPKYHLPIRPCHQYFQREIQWGKIRLMNLLHHALHAPLHYPWLTVWKNTHISSDSDPLQINQKNFEFCSNQYSNINITQFIMNINQYIYKKNKKQKKWFQQKIELNNPKIFFWEYKNVTQHLCPFKKLFVL